MRLFGRSAPSARSRLFSPDFECATAPGALGLHIDYAPDQWVPLPGLGVDRTAWVDAVCAAHAEDLGWTAGTPEGRVLRGIADAVADSSAGYTASLLGFGRTPEEYALVHVDALDDELLALKWADPASLLADGDEEVPRTYPQGWRYNGRQQRGEHGRLEFYNRAYKPLDTTPPIHLVGLTTFSAARLSGPSLVVLARTKVVMDDGRQL